MTRQWILHCALNLGQAYRDIIYFFEYPKNKTKNYSFIYSPVLRTKNFFQNLFFAILPPKLTGHSKKELDKEFSNGKFKEWFLYGYKPWKNKKPK